MGPFRLEPSRLGMRYHSALMSQHEGETAQLKILNRSGTMEILPVISQAFGRRAEYE